MQGSTASQSRQHSTHPQHTAMGAAERPKDAETAQLLPTQESSADTETSGQAATKALGDAIRTPLFAWFLLAFSVRPSARIMFSGAGCVALSTRQMLAVSSSAPLPELI